MLLHDGATGVLQAVLNASAITEIRTAAVSAVATKLLARPGRASRRDPRLRRPGTLARDAMRTVVDDPELRVWSRDPAHAEALALESHAVVCATVEEALDGAEIVCTCTAAREPDRPARVARAGRARQRRRLVRAVRPRARGGRRRRGVALRRPAGVDACNESGDYLRAVEEAGIGPDHIRAELGELLVGAHPGRSSDDELTLFKSLGLAVEDLAAAALCVGRARERGLGVEVPF